jgi:ABC-2 type transport system ATP-binding protein
MTSNTLMIEARGLTRRFVTKSGVVEAVRGVDLRVPQGEIVGLLGPNGAGKSTTMRMLTTLLPPDAGEATVACYDLRRAPERVRERIGYVSQAGGADGASTARENLVLQCRLYGATRAAALDRAQELLATCCS